MATWPTIKVNIDFNENPTYALWPDVGAYFRSGTVQRGVSRFDGVTGRAEAGTASAVLDNRDARFDPTNLSGPYVSGGVTQIMPRRKWVLQARWSSTDYPLFNGFVESWRPTYPLHGKDATTAVTGIDATSVYAQFEGIAQAPVGGSERTDQRISRIATLVGSPTSLALDAGATTVQATTLAGNAWGLVSLAVDTEMGELWIWPGGGVAGGILTFKKRHSLLTRSSMVTLQPGTSTPFDSVELVHDALQLRTRVTIGRVGGTAVTDDDTTAQSHYGIRTFARTDLIHETDAESTDAAGYLLHLLAQPELRIDSVTIDPQASPTDLFPHVLARDIGDKVTIAFTPPGGSAISRTCFIRGVSHTIQQGAGWSTTWQLQDASRFNFLVFDDATLGKLDSNAVGY